MPIMELKPQRTTIPDGIVEHIVKRWFDGTELDKVFYNDVKRIGEMLKEPGQETGVSSEASEHRNWGE